MSAVAGIYHLDGRPVDKQVMQSMVDRMSHRGPDAQDLWTNGAVGLGHCMLHTTPESFHAALPRVSEQSGCVITADARIDNRDELKNHLRLSSDSERVIPDSTLILRAYEKWGRDCVDHLLGAFVFAIWDPRERHLFCAKDHFGVRPLYYYHEQGKLFAFASEIKALFQVDGVPKVPDEVKVADHLMAPVEEDVTRTYFKHVRRLAPAHTLVVKSDSAINNQYWSLDPSREIRLASDEEYTERFQTLFEKAVRARLRSAHPIGCMLSGGLDSSSITCQAAQILRDSNGKLPLHTFSAVFDKFSDSDERPFIEAVLQKYDDELSPHLIRVDKKSPLAEWDELCQFLDGACPWGNRYIQWRLLRSAREQGVRVLLDGFDGDTTVSHGTGYFNQLREEGKWLSLVREVAQYARTNDESPRDAVWSWIKGPLFSLPGFSQLVKVRRTVKGFVNGQERATQKVSEEPAWRRALSEMLIQKVEPYLEEKEDPKPPTQRENQYRLLTRSLMTRIFDVHSYVSPSSSVSLRYPFYDKRLVEYCLALPPDQKLRRGWSRLVLRRGMENILPHSIQWRKGKGDLSHGFDQGLVTHERSLLERLMQGELGGVNRFVSSDFLQEAVPNYLEGEIGTGSEGEGLVVWRALSLALWFQHLEE